MTSPARFVRPPPDQLTPSKIPSPWRKTLEGDEVPSPAKKRDHEQETRIPRPPVRSGGGCARGKVRLIVRSSQVEESVDAFVRGLPFERDSVKSNVVHHGDVSFEIVNGKPATLQCVVFCENKETLAAQMILAGWARMGAEFIFQSPVDGTQIKLELQ